MDKYFIILSLVSLLWCFLGIKTLLSGRSKKINIIFGLLCLAMFVWSFFTGLVYVQHEQQRMILCMKIAYIGIFFFFSINLHFYLAISKTRIVSWLYLLLYALPAILSFVNFYDFFVFKDLRVENNTVVAVINHGSVLLYLYILYIALTCIAGFVVILRWYLRTNINKEKIHALFIIVIFTIQIIGAFIMTMVLPMMGIFRFQYAGCTISFIYVIILYFLISRFRFMDLQKILMADEIIANISDLVFILDPDMNIIRAHSGGDSVPAKIMKRIQGESYYDVVSDNRELREQILELRSGRISNFSLLVNYRLGDEYILTRTNFSMIKDRFGDQAGYIAISHEVREMKHFRTKFGITEREAEIVALSVSGMSYRDMADSLSISERTVERHLTNIYNKMGINNKIELFRLADEFNIRM